MHNSTVYISFPVSSETSLLAFKVWKLMKAQTLILILIEFSPTMNWLKYLLYVDTNNCSILYIERFTCVNFRPDGRIRYTSR